MIITSCQSDIHANRDFTRPRGPEFIRILCGICAPFLCVSVLSLFANASSAPLPQSGKGAQDQADDAFVTTAKALAKAPVDDAEAIEKLETKALTILDSIVLNVISVRGTADLESLNARLAALATRGDAPGESYHVLRLAGQTPVYALAADFGLGAPSAVRLYARENSGKLALAARIDRSAQKDFLDDSLEFVPIPGSAVVFVTVAGRTDDLQTGVFTAWQFDAQGLHQLWTSDLVQQSNYQINADGFQVTYCKDPDDDNPHTCHAMIRERYQWRSGEWRRVESVPVQVPKP
jgi:hypothetical protein